MVVRGAVVEPCFVVPECSLGACVQIESIGPGTCPLSADINGDGLVDGADLGLVLEAWGTCPPLTIGCSGDLNFDGLIDGADLGVVLEAWK